MSPTIPLHRSPHRRRFSWVALVVVLAALGRWLYQDGQPLQPMTVSAGPLQPIGSVLRSSLGQAEHLTALNFLPQPLVEQAAPVQPSLNLGHDAAGGVSVPSPVAALPQLESLPPTAAGRSTTH